MQTLKIATPPRNISCENESVIGLFLLEVQKWQALSQALKMCLFVVLSSVAMQLQAQQWTGSSNQYGLIDREGAIQVGSGVGRTAIGNGYGQSLNWGTGYLGFNMLRSGNIWSFSGDGANNGGTVIYGDVGGGLHISTLPSNAFTPNGANGTMTDTDVIGKEHFFISSTGKVVIGNVPSPNGYRLFVEEGILTERLKVALHTTTDWADYVFQDTFKLKPLTEVDTFIRKHKHLPDMPSACELVENGGIDVKQIVTLQQAKIEELFLYILALNAQLQRQQQLIQQLSK